MCQTYFKKVAIKTRSLQAKQRKNQSWHFHITRARESYSTHRKSDEDDDDGWLGRMRLISDAPTDGKRPSLFAYLH